MPIDTITTTGSGTWTVPGGVTEITVTVWGAGGKGGTRSTNGGGGGGGGGASSVRTFTSLPTGIAYFVGAGASGTSAGEDTWFYSNSSTGLLAKGGNSVADNSITGATGGASGSGYGDTRYGGGDGADAEAGSPSNGGGGGSSAGTAANGTDATDLSTSGAVAPSGGGDGGNGSGTNNSGGFDGLAPGGGGGGAKRTSSGTHLGGYGAAGQITISYTDTTFAASGVLTLGGLDTSGEIENAEPDTWDLSWLGSWGETWEDASTSEASGSLTLGGINLSGTSRFAEPDTWLTSWFGSWATSWKAGADVTFSASGILDLGALELTGSASSLDPIFDSTAAFTLGALELTGSASSIDPVFDSTGALTLGALELTGSASSVDPIFDSIATFTLGGLELTGSASSLDPIFDSTAAFTLGGLQLIGSASSLDPIFDSTAAFTLGALEFTGSASSLDPIFDSTASLLLGAIEFAGSASSLDPVYDGTGSFALGGIELTGSASSIDPVYDSTGNLTLGSLELTGSASSLDPIFESSGSFILGGIELTGSASSLDPSYDATGNLELGALTFSSSALFSPPVYDSTASLLLGGIEVAGGLDNGDPTYDSIASLILGGLELTGSASSIAPVFSSSGSVTLGGLELTGSASSIDPNFSASGTFTLGGLELTGSASSLDPSYDATGSLILASIEISGSLTSSDPVFAASGSLTLGSIEVSGSLQSSAPTYNATGSLELPAITLSGSASSLGPSFIASGEFTLPPITLSGSGLSNFVIYPDEFITVPITGLRRLRAEWMPRWTEAWYNNHSKYRRFMQGTLFKMIGEHLPNIDEEVNLGFYGLEGQLRQAFICNNLRPETVKHLGTITIEASGYNFYNYNFIAPYTPSSTGVLVSSVVKRVETLGDFFLEDTYPCYFVSNTGSLILRNLHHVAISVVSSGGYIDIGPADAIFTRAEDSPVLVYNQYGDYFKVDPRDLSYDNKIYVPFEGTYSVVFESEEFLKKFMGITSLHSHGRHPVVPKTFYLKIDEESYFPTPFDMINQWDYEAAKEGIRRQPFDSNTKLKGKIQYLSLFKDPVVRMAIMMNLHHVEYWVPNTTLSIDPGYRYIHHEVANTPKKYFIASEMLTPDGEGNYYFQYKPATLGCLFLNNSLIEEGNYVLGSNSVSGILESSYNIDSRRNLLASYSVGMWTPTYSGDVLSGIVPLDDFLMPKFVALTSGIKATQTPKKIKTWKWDRKITRMGGQSTFF